MRKKETIFTGADGNAIRPWNSTPWKSEDSWSANGSGGGRAHVPGVRDRQGWVTLPGGGRSKSPARDASL